MKVKLDKSIFLSSSSNHDALRYLFLVITYHEHHKMQFDFEPKATSAYKELPKKDQELLDTVYIEQIVSSDSSTCDCEIKDRTFEDKKKIFSVDEGIRYLMQPISILVENSLNDSYFVRALFRCIDSTQLLSKLDENHFIQFENLGGCTNVRNFIESRIQYFGGKTKFLNCFALFDGDKTNPVDRQTKYNDIIKFLRTCNVEYHILEKRSMENYMPDEAMNSFRSANNERWLDSYLALSPEQKDFIDFSKGFLKDVTPEIKEKAKNRKPSKSRSKKKKTKESPIYRSYLPHDIQNFYSNVSDANYKHLESPFNIGKNFKTEFPKKFEDEVYVYKKNLLERTSHQKDQDELQNIVNKILKLA